MILINGASNEAEALSVFAVLRAERTKNAGASGMHSTGGWHTTRFGLGEGWLGKAALRRIERSQRSERRGVCWGNILPPGAEYRAHRHGGERLVAVWCLSGNGALCIEPDVVIPDRSDQLVFFPGDRKHWVPRVDVERVTVAINLR